MATIGLKKYLTIEAEPPKRGMNYMQFDYFDKMYIRELYGITNRILERLLFLYNEGFFPINNYMCNHLHLRKDSNVLELMEKTNLLKRVRKHYKSVYIKDIEEKKPYYMLTKKARKIVEEYYRLQQGKPYNLNMITKNKRLFNLFDKINKEKLKNEAEL